MKALSLSRCFFDLRALRRAMFIGHAPDIRPKGFAAN